MRSDNHRGPWFSFTWAPEQGGARVRSQTNYPRAGTLCIPIGSRHGESSTSAASIRYNMKQHGWLLDIGQVSNLYRHSHCHIFKKRASSFTCDTPWQLTCRTLRRDGSRKPAQCGRGKPPASKWRRSSTTRNPNFKMLWFSRGGYFLATHRC